MILVLCDKCGKELNQFDWSPVRFPYIKIEKVYDMTTTIAYNLCYDCRGKLEKWLEEKELDVK